MKNVEIILKCFNDYASDSETLREQVRLHFELLMKWQRIVNLIGLTKEEEIAEFLYIDSFLAIKNLCEFLSLRGMSIPEVADIGSGAGFPSIFWSFFMPDIRVILYEPKRKKANFLRDFIHLADIKNYEVKEMMVKKESILTHLIISKAAININDWPRFGISNVRRQGVVVSLLTEETMKIYSKTIEKTPRVRESVILKYTLPLSKQERFIGVLIKK
jgi:16S rRNA (guanine527-N7)-methyltransferase